MFLFKPEHVPMIVAHRPRRKTQTRRLHKSRRAIPGSQHWAQRGMTAETRFAKLLVSRSWKEPLGAITVADANAEGYDSRQGYFDAFERINGAVSHDTEVWCYEFGVVGVTEFGRREAANALGVQVWPRAAIWGAPMPDKGYFRAACDCGCAILNVNLRMPRSHVEQMVKDHRIRLHSVKLDNPAEIATQATLIAPLIEVDSSPLPR